MAEPAVAILGVRGMLGSDLVVACRDRGIKAAGFDLPEFDITDDGQVRRAITAADAVVNCAAYTNVDKAESEPDIAHRVNGEAVGRLGELAAEAGKWVLHISTDFVFDGMLDRPYRETDEPHPISEYGRSKLAGEQLLLNSGCRACIPRVQWTYGRGGVNFVRKILDRARGGGPFNVVDDQIGSPTATTAVAEAMVELIRLRPTGVFHFAAGGYASRFEVARRIVAAAGVSCVVSPCKSSDYPSPAARPPNSRFDCAKIQALLGHEIRPWQEDLEAFVRQL